MHLTRRVDVCRATLMYLAFVSQDSLPQDFRQVGGTACSSGLASWRAVGLTAHQDMAFCRPRLDFPVPLAPSLQSLAVDISLAALLGEDVYNFGELLLHPVVRGRCRWRRDTHGWQRPVQGCPASWCICALLDCLCWLLSDSCR
jgi:hypothetical protein